MNERRCRKLDGMHIQGEFGESQLIYMHSTSGGGSVERTSVNVNLAVWAE